MPAGGRGTLACVGLLSLSANALACAGEPRASAPQPSAAGAQAQPTDAGSALVPVTPVVPHDAAIGGDARLPPDAARPNASDDAGSLPDDDAGTDAGLSTVCPAPDGRVLEPGMGMGFRGGRETSSRSNSARHSIVPETRSVSPGDPPTTVFEGPADGNVRGMLIFVVNESFEVPDLLGKHLTHTFSNTFLDCVHNGGDPRLPDEEAVRAQAALRDDQEQLLILAAPATPSAPDGKLYVDSALAPEFDVRWVKTESPDCDRRTLALELTVRASGTRVTASYEQRAGFDLNGRKYVLAVGHVEPPDGSEVCGPVMWVVYREDMLIRKR